MDLGDYPHCTQCGRRPRHHLAAQGVHRLPDEGEEVTTRYTPRERHNSTDDRARREIRVGQLAYSGMPARHIARELGCTTRQVIAHLEAMGVTIIRHRQPKPPNGGHGHGEHCGKERGYQAHRYRKEPACDPCLAAHRAYESERKRAKKAEA